LLGLPRVSVASIDEDIMTTLAIYMIQRGQIDLLISILRSDPKTSTMIDSRKTSATTTTTTTTTAATTTATTEINSSSMNKVTISTHHPWDKLWLQVAHHMCERNEKTVKRSTHSHHHSDHDRDLLSLLMRLSEEEEEEDQLDPSQIDRASSQNDRAFSQIFPQHTTLISRSGLLAMVRLTIQTMIKKGETQRAEQLAKIYKI